MERYLTKKAASHILRKHLAAPMQAANENALDDQVVDMPYADFLDWCPDGLHAEWIDGKVLVMSPASLRHQQIVTFLVALLSEYVKRTGLGEVLPAPFQMRLSDQRRGREPDLLFVAAEHLDRITETYLDGPADLVIEVISPESEVRDRGDKFIEYEAAGIREYWLIDPKREEVDFFVLDVDGYYRLVEISHDGRYISSVLQNFRFDVDWLWQQPLPSVIDLLSKEQRS